jgi:hypothetical protein
MDLSSLTDEELTSVEFVEQHLALHFGEALLTLYVWPDIADADGISVGFGQPGYRDALCSVIGETVTQAAFHEETALTVEFENGTVLALSLREEDMDIAEAGGFVSADGSTTFQF